MSVFDATVSVTVFECRPVDTKPVDSDSGAPETIITGPYAPRRKRGEGYPLTIQLGVWGSVVSSFNGASLKLDFIRISGQK